MLSKDDVLVGVGELAARGELRKDELVKAFDMGAAGGGAAGGGAAGGGADFLGLHLGFGTGRRVNLAQVLYYVGGGIVVVGIAILIAQNWAKLSDLTRILSTLGSGVLAYAIAVLLGRGERARGVSAAFHLIAALVLPIGLFVTFKIAGYDTSNFGTQNLVFGILLAMYLASLAVFRQTIFVLFSIIFSSMLYFSLTGTLSEGSTGLFGGKFFEYQWLILGLSYLVIGYGLRETRWRALTGVGYFIGLPIALGTALVLGDFKPNANLFWELIFPFLTFGAIVGSIWLRSRAFLAWGTIFLMGYIFKITGEYFSDSLGWPMALVIAGLTVIGVGWASISVRKFWVKKPAVSKSLS